MSRILLFGSTGFLGSSIYNKLLQSKHEVFTVDRLPQKNNQNRSFSADFLAPDTYMDLMVSIDPEIVISTPWATGDGFWQSENNYEYMRATVSLAEIALSRDVSRFIGLGSSAEYGETIEDCNSSTTDLHPTTIYGKAKADTGESISEISKLYGKEFNWLRIFQAYGKYEKKSRLIPQVINSLSSGEKVTLQNTGRVLDWIHDEDVANAVDYIISTGIHDHFLDIGTSEGRAVIDVVRKLASLLEVSEDLIEFRAVNSDDQISRLVCSAESTLFRLGWKPAITLDQGLSKVVHK